MGVVEEARARGSRGLGVRPLRVAIVTEIEADILNTHVTVTIFDL